MEQIDRLDVASSLSNHILPNAVRGHIKSNFLSHGSTFVGGSFHLTVYILPWFILTCWRDRAVTKAVNPSSENVMFQIA